MTTIEILLNRIHTLKNSNHYTGTICEFDLDDDDVCMLKSKCLYVMKRDCKVYPYYITWPQ